MAACLHCTHAMSWDCHAMEAISSTSTRVFDPGGQPCPLISKISIKDLSEQKSRQPLSCHAHPRHGHIQAIPASALGDCYAHHRHGHIQAVSASPLAECYADHPHGHIMAIPAFPLAETYDRVEVTCNQDQFDQAVDDLFINHVEGSAFPSNLYWPLLKACTKQKDIHQLRRLHSYLVLCGLCTSSPLAEELVSAFALSGCIGSALQVMQKLPYRTGVSWQALITFDVRQGKFREALNLFQRMQHDSVQLDEFTGTNLLKACAAICDSEKGMLLHQNLTSKGLHGDAFVCSALISLYGKCGMLIEAESVFCLMFEQDVASWNAMLLAYVEHGKGENSLQLYRQMHEEGPHQNERTIVAVLAACCLLARKEVYIKEEDCRSKLMCLEIGQAIHANYFRSNVRSNVIVNNSLLNLYSRCGSIAEAEHMFANLSSSDVVSWTALLSTYVERCDSKNALHLYKQLQQEGIPSDNQAMVVAIQACGVLAETQVNIVKGQTNKLVALEITKALHVDSQLFDLDPFVGSILISVYGLCGSLVDSENVFHGLSLQNTVTWNSMLSVYVELGDGEKALRLYRQMFEEGMHQDEQTFLTALQAICMLAEKAESAVLQGMSVKSSLLQIGQALHADGKKRGFDSDTFFCSILLHMYNKCGRLQDLEHFFDAVHQQCVVSWTVLLTAYIEHDQVEKALVLYGQMHQEGIKPNEWTFLGALQACSRLAEEEMAPPMEGQRFKPVSWSIGQAICKDGMTEGFMSNIFLSSSVLKLFAFCGDIVEAEQVFAEMPDHDIVSWNAMLSAYVQQGEGEKALLLFRQMQEEEGSANEVTYAVALQACCLLAARERTAMEEGKQKQVMMYTIGQTLNADAHRNNFHLDIFVSSNLLTMYGSCGALVEAENVFAGLHDCDAILWTRLLLVYIENNQCWKALQLHRQMHVEGVTPDALTFATTLKACCRLADIEESANKSFKIICLEIGQGLHVDACSKGFNLDSAVCGGLISMYGKSGSVFEAENVFRGSLQHNADIWKTLLLAYVESNEEQKAQQLYFQMQEAGMAVADVITLSTVLRACSRTGTLETCRQINAAIVLVGLDSNIVVVNTLIHAYGSCGSMEEAQAIFNALPHHDVVSWNTLISGYSREGNYAATIHNFKRMLIGGIHPNEAIFLSVLSSCSHAGCIDVGMQVFESMTREFGLIPQMEHYGCLISLLGRAGSWVRLKEVLTSMPMQPSLSIWLLVLGSCQQHGNVELGMHAFDSAFQLQPNYAPAYVLLSNMIANAEQEDLVIQSDDNWMKETTDHMVVPIVDDCSFSLQKVDACVSALT